jgi:probable HAF family extracellular repeat protein
VVRTFLAALILAPATALGGGWNIIPLATLGGAEGEANGINNAGQVVGRARDASGRFRAVRWDPDGRVVDLGVLPGGEYSVARRINDRGEAAGLSHTAGGNDHAVFWDDSGITDVGTLGGPRSFAQDLNDSGVVVGSSDAQRGSRAFTWTKAGGLVDYGNFNPDDRLLNAGFNGVNNAGRAVGTSFRLLEPFRAMMADLATRELVDLGPPGRSLSMATAVNDAGVIVGYSSRDGGLEQAAVFHGPDDFSQLGTMGLDESWAEDVNEAGDIVGTAFSPSVRFRPFLYRGGTMHDLTALLPENSGWDELTSAMAINDAGVIVGTGRYHGVLTGYTLSEVPEPAVVASAALLLPALARRRRIV